MQVWEYPETFITMNCFAHKQNDCNSQNKPL